MAKIAFTKLGLSRNNSVKEVEWNGQKIEVKQYLPIGNKLDLISQIVNLSSDDHLFFNPCKVEIFKTIGIILTYTNINVTDKQSEDSLKLYDLFVNSGFAEAIEQEIPIEEFNFINSSIDAIIKEIYRYRDSVMGIMDQISEDQKASEDEVTNLIDMIKNSKEIQNLQELSTKLG